MKSDKEISEKTDNLQKYENYKEQFKRLDRALSAGFNLEAVFIEYAVLEDRSSSILRYENNSIKPKGDRPPSLDAKLKKIKTIAREKKSLPNRYFTDEFIDRIIEWKEKRNRIIHALLKQSLTTEGLVLLAEEGKKLARELSNKAGNYKRAVERKNKNEKRIDLDKQNL
ncbi:MAG: hypothetical protein IJK56_06650 [Firmicutes bacterium]|nr:hypothetical protein [Bacillota bacterium]